MELDDVALQIIFRVPITAERRVVDVPTTQFVQSAFVPLALVQQKARPDFVPSSLDGRRFLPRIAPRIEQPGHRLDLVQDGQDFGDLAPLELRPLLLAESPADLPARYGLTSIRHARAGFGNNLDLRRFRTVVLLDDMQGAEEMIFREAGRKVGGFHIDRSA